jgi:hypothetical protein
MAAVRPLAGCVAGVSFGRRGRLGKRAARMAAVASHVPGAGRTPSSLAPDLPDGLLHAPDLADHGVDPLAHGADLLARD